MAQVGLKETLSLLAAGYKKKDIEALAAIDEQEAQNAEEEKPAEKQPEEKPEEGTDYKEMYEALLKEKEAADKQLKNLQQDNVHANSAPMAEEQRKAQQDSLTNLVRGFM